MTDSTELPHVLLVEDDLELQQLVKDYLERNQFEVSVESNGAQAVTRVLQSNFDMVILDLMLPGMDGISVCREIRHRFAGPVLILTASGDSVDHVVGLEVGADDFIQKPVEPRVLLARMRARLRHVVHAPPAQPVHSTDPVADLMEIGELRINRSSREAVLCGKLLALSTPEYELLVLLAENAGQVLSREDIFKALRNLPYDGQNRFVDVAMSQIRKQFGSHANHYLKTVRGKGYLLAVAHS